MMNKKRSGVILFCIIILFLASCDVYDSLYGEEEVLPLENVDEEVDQTLEEILQEPTSEEETTEEGEVSEEELTQEESAAQDEKDTEESVEEEIMIEESEENIAEEETTEEETAEEEVMKETEEASAEAVVVTVEETELVSLVPEAQDPDQDKLVFTFSSPLDENGEWQTDYTDAGEYTLTITASDGELTTSQEVLIIVTKKEEAPTIDSSYPEDDTLDIKETESLEFSVSASDLNKEELYYSWKLDGDEVSEEEEYTYETSYDDSGAHTVKIDVSDEASTVSRLWSVTVENVNRKPVLEEIDTIKVKETETVYIDPVAEDPDGDDITFTISEPVGDSGEWETSYDDAGEYTITVKATDGKDTVSTEVNVIVENVNRAPVITGIIQK